VIHVHVYKYLDFNFVHFGLTGVQEHYQLRYINVFLFATTLHIRFSQLTLNTCISMTLLNIPWKWVYQYGLTVTGWCPNEDIMVSVWYVEKFKQIYSSGLLYMTLIFREYWAMWLIYIYLMLTKIQVFAYMYMYHNFLSLYSMFISPLIQFLKLSMK
jgi:hypothetical protein